MNTWQPTAPISNLKQRATFIRQVREFFFARQVTEVDTPLLADFGSTDLHLDSFRTTDNKFLQTSPEMYMKRLLAAGIGPCYQICKAFREEEISARHNPEFTILEWYRPSWKDTELMQEVAELIHSLVPFQHQQTKSFRHWFLEILQLDPFEASSEQLARECQRVGGMNAEHWDRDEQLDFLVSLVIEPALPKNQLCFITHYPASQAALAKKELDDHGHPVARRFEAYLGGLELANGYWELIDAKEQQERFEQDQTLRKQHGKPEIPYDQSLIQALKHGMPDSSGVAMGLDRLFMLALGSKQISDLIAFADN